MSIKPISIEEAVKHLDGYQYQIHELNSDKNVYKTMNAINTEHPEITKNMGVKLIKRLGDERIITRKESGGRVVYSLHSLAKYQIALEELKNNFFTIEDVLKELGFEKRIKKIYPYMYEEKFRQLHSNGHVKIILFDHKIQNNTIFIPIDEVKRFKDEYISWIDAAKEAGVILLTFQQYWMGNYTSDIIRLNNDSDFIYIKKSDWQLFLQEKRKTQYIAKDKVAKKLGIHANGVVKVANEFNIVPFKEDSSPFTYFKKDDAELLAQKQNELWEKIRNEYFTDEETMSMLGIARSTLSQRFIRDNIRSIFVPPLICTIRDGINFRNGRELIYLKEDVLSFNEQRQKEKEIENIIHQTDSNSYDILQTALSASDIQFSEKGKKTEAYWFKYLKRKGSKSKASDASKKKEVRVLFNTTVLLTEMTSLKEIFDYTERELNLSIFNSSTASSVQTEMYKFLRQVSDTRTDSDLYIRYKFNNLKNIYKKKKNTQNEKTIYSIDEYIRLIDYAKDIEKHKKRAIEDIRLQIKGEGHKHRDSSWLYVLLHLNNAWRHYDVTLFPRINLKETQIESMEPLNALDWLEKNNLNKKEIATIVNQVKRMPFIHSKTKKKRYFFCSEELSDAFVHALVLCELRCRICQPLSEMVIDFGNRPRNFKETQRRTYFEGYDSDFTFKSKQMNRTLISYVYSVIKKTTNRNPLEVTKYVRSHASEETTNIYIDIPQEQMDFITSQLFDLGNFGYAYDALSELLLPETPMDREERTKNSLMVKKVFGDAYQIEQTARYLNRLTEEQQIVRKVIEGFTLRERQEISDSIKIGQHPAKKEGYQCIYRACKFPSRDCEKCQFAVPNFYALSQLADDFYLKLNEFKRKFDTTPKDGEKIRLSNNLYSYLYLIGAAVDKFGKDTVSSFFENGLESVKEELALIPSAREYVTIPNIK
jgi:hypothetical protein